MYSKYFGDSAKIVSGTFATIKKMLSEDEKCLFIILIDEIESLAGARSQTMGSNEPKDSLRVSYKHANYRLPPDNSSSRQ